MIADDMMSFIKSDIIVFGIGVFIFIVFTLWFIFKNIKMGCDATIRLCNFSYFNDWFIRFIGWKVTVISSNFIALMLILNMAMNIHVTVRFLQLKKKFIFEKSDAVLKASKNDASCSLHCFNNYLRFFIFNI